MGLLGFLSRATTWWNRETLGTQLYTWRKGVKVGEDSAGNIFFRDKEDRRRWVIFNGEVEASRVSAEWHGWLHGLGMSCQRKIRFRKNLGKLIINLMLLVV